MEKLEYCRVCGQQVSSKARKCPHCGARLKRRHILLKIILGIMALALLSAVMKGLFPSLSKQQNNASYKASAVQNDSGKAGTAASTPGVKSKPTAIPTKKPTPTPAPLPGLGERVEKKDVVVTLSNVVEKTRGTYFSPEEGNVFILCELTIENNTSKELEISSLMCVDFYYDGFAASIDLEAMAEKGSANQLDGSIAAGKKMKGVVGYQIPKDWKEIEVHFKPNVWGSQVFMFKVEHDDLP